MPDSAWGRGWETVVVIENPPSFTPVRPRLALHVPFTFTSSGRTHSVCSSPPSIRTTVEEWLVRRTGRVSRSPSTPVTVMMRVVVSPERSVVAVHCVPAASLDQDSLVDVKAVTWHEASAAARADGTWRGTIVLDI